MSNVHIQLYLNDKTGKELQQAAIDMVEQYTAHPKITQEIIRARKNPEQVARLGINHFPAIKVWGDTDYGITMYVSHTEITRQILNIGVKLSGGYKALVSHGQARNIQAITGPATVNVFISPEKVKSIQAATVAMDVASLNPHIDARIVDVQAFPQWALIAGVRALPHYQVGTLSECGCIPHNILVNLLRAQGEQAWTWKKHSSL